MDFKNTAKQVTAKYIREKRIQAENLKIFQQIKPKVTHNGETVNKSEEIRKIKEPLLGGLLNFPAHHPLLMTLKQLREYVPERKNPIEADNLDEIKPTTKILSLKQPNKLSVPLQEDNRECEESWICDDQLRFRIPIFFYDQHIERFTKDQLENLKYWHAVIRDQCDQQHTELVDQLDASHSFSSRLHHMHPSCWQTGLLDMGNSYAYHYKDVIKHLLGENIRDRDSSRETLNLEEPLSALMGGSFKKEQAEEMILLLSVDDEEYALEVKEFVRICALAERLFYCQNIRIYGEEGYAMQQGILEKADFHLIIKRLGNVKLTDSLQKFFQRLGLLK
ncbi:hypothetical protein ACTXT7_011084 [Hymenolepis weldensis]